jgi:NitT/TauT family transport system substrate-binding protein
MPNTQTRRQFLTGLSLTSAGGLLGARPALAAEAALEISTVRVAKVPGICIAPQYVAEELLRAEGFIDVRYVETIDTPRGIAGGEVDFGLNFASVLVAGLDRGIDLTVLGGVHVGCFELFVNDATRSLTELKGKRVGITYLGSPGHLFLAAMAAHVGIMLAGNRAFVRNNPVATKAVVRAMLKADDLCVSDPARAAQRLVDGGFTPRYDYALQSLNEIPYDKWREYDPEDTVRFYALRLHEVGMVKSSPQKIIADNTDWRFFNEVRRELKA